MRLPSLRGELRWTRDWRRPPNSLTPPTCPPTVLPQVRLDPRIDDDCVRLDAHRFRLERQGLHLRSRGRCVPTRSLLADAFPRLGRLTAYVVFCLADGTIPSGTCVISGGTWYKGGTCAGFTLGEITGGAVTLTSSKGLCAVDATTGVLGCSASVTQGAEFVMADDGTLNLGGSTAFSAGTYPAGSAQVPISKGSAGAIPLTLKYVAQ